MALVPDAVGSKNFYRVVTFSQGRISESVLKELYLDLDEEEVISIIFLMTNNATDISAVINALKNDCKNRFFEITKEINWGEKLLEALITIDNINVVNRLAFEYDEIEEMKIRYSYNIHNASENLNRIIKSLYFLCKELTKLEVKKLVEEVYRDLNEPVLDLLEEKQFLEIYILDWIQKKYISIDTAKPKLNKFIHILKINVLLPPTFDFESWKSSDVNNVKNKQDSSTNSGHSLKLQNTENIVIPDCNEFPWKDEKHKRLCIIVNQVNFKNQLLYQTREGSDTDEKNICETFKGMNFEILQKRNLTKAGMIELLNSLNEKEYNKYAAIFLFILSHGNNGEVIFSDDGSIKVEKIEQKVCCKNLQKVFKVVILQSCQGKNLGLLNNKLVFDSPVEVENQRRKLLENNSSCIYQKHFVLYQATVNDYISIRHETEGSWFIQDACAEIRKTTPIKLTQWAKNVNKRVGERKAESTKEGTYVVQVPVLRTTISKDYEFPKYNENLRN